MLPESKIYSFYDEKLGFNLHFLEGQKLILDLAQLHQLKGSGFSLLRDCALSFQLLIKLLKNHENIGIFIDSEIPFFRFKLESDSRLNGSL